MCMYGDQLAGDACESEEPACALADPVADHFRDLFLGRPGESDEQGAARLVAAREVFAELLEDGRTDAITRQDALYVATLVGVAVLSGTVDVLRSFTVKKAA